MASNVVTTAMEFDHSVVDLSDNSTTVHGGQCIVRGFWVNTTNSHEVVIKNGTASVFTVPASATAGAFFALGDAHFKTSLVVDPHDSATGSFTLLYSPAIG